MGIFWSGVFAILLTAIVSGVWTALLLTNLAHAPAFPWSSLVMAALLWALVAGLFWVVFLAGFWIVMGQLVSVPGNKLPDFSALPLGTVIATLVMACASGAVSEEAGFRGYFQGSLERAGVGAAAILCTALLFYLLVDAMLGALAYFTKSIRPGVVVHAVGLFTFFGVIWPRDKQRLSIWQSGTDIWFWIHLAQAVLFAILSLLALRRLARSPWPT